MIKAQWFENFTLEEAVEIIRTELETLEIPHLICRITEPAPSSIVRCAIMQNENWWHFAEDVANWFDLIYLQKEIEGVWYLVFLRKLEDVQEKENA